MLQFPLHNKNLHKRSFIIKVQSLAERTRMSNLPTKKKQKKCGYQNLLVPGRFKTAQIHTASKLYRNTNFNRKVASMKAQQACNHRQIWNCGSWLPVVQKTLRAHRPLRFLSTTQSSTMSAVWRRYKMRQACTDWLKHATTPCDRTSR